MGILNVTPDSFSDGGRFAAQQAAVERAEEMIEEGVDIIDVGGESTRPGAARVEAGDEIERTCGVIRQITDGSDTPVSIDTTRSEVARIAISESGAEIINDISGLRWDSRIADIAAQTGAGLVLMHSRGEFESMHSQKPVSHVLDAVRDGLSASIDLARTRGVADESIALDVGIGFGKTLEQNLELIANLDNIVDEFEKYPILVGTSRKSFIGKLMGGAIPSERLPGSLATALIALNNGAKILRVHDVKETVAAVKIFTAVMDQRK